MRSLVLLTILLAGVASGQTPPAGLFDYDASQPLAIEKKSTREVTGARIADLSYASPRGGRVPAFLVVPTGKGPHAGIVYVHWGQGDRSSFLAEAVLMARCGAASLLMDNPDRRPSTNRPPGGLDHPEVDLQGWVQGVVDARRAVDLLVAEAHVDPARIGYVGHSYGATLGGVMAVSERRFRTLVLMAGFASLSRYIQASIAGDSRIPPDKAKHYLEVLSVIDAERYLGQAAPASLLLQFARVDRFIDQQQAEAYEKAASSPKRTLWYEGGHEFFDPAALADRGDWLARELRLSPFAPVWREASASRVTAPGAPHNRAR